MEIITRETIVSSNIGDRIIASLNLAFRNAEVYFIESVLFITLLITSCSVNSPAEDVKQFITTFGVNGENIAITLYGLCGILSWIVLLFVDRFKPFTRHLINFISISICIISVAVSYKCEFMTAAFGQGFGALVAGSIISIFFIASVTFMINMYVKKEIYRLNMEGTPYATRRN